MQKLKKAALGALNGLLLLAPAVAHGQTWDASLTAAQTNAGLPSGSITNIVISGLTWLLGLLGFLAIIGFVISGILYLTAAGNETQAEQAKNAMTYSIIGVVVALLGYVIIQAVNLWLGGASTNF
jgi:hypothetical protein